MTKFEKILDIVISVLMIVCGILFFVVPDSGYVILAYSVGAVILLIGLAELVVFIRFGVGLLGGGWVLCDAVCSIIFGIFLLCNETFTMAFLPFVCGLWIVALGFVRFVGSFDLMKLRLSNWWTEMLIGLLDVAIGLIFCFLPEAGALTSVICVGILLIVGGVSNIVDLIYFWKAKRYVKKFLPIDVDVKDKK
jgi:uncharacterized membrane protein HdeD (DUF308 family)